MLIITLPNGNQLQFDHPVTIDEVAAHISVELREAALAGKIGDKLFEKS